MSHLGKTRFGIITALALGLAWSSTLTVAQSKEVEGIIKARNGEAMTLQLKDSTELVVILNDGTQVGQTKGVLKARHKEMSMAALIPGLAIKVKGNLNAGNQLVADTIRFDGDDLKQAQAIQAGMHETNQQVQQNTAGVQQNSAELEKQKADIQAAVSRFGQLDDYYIRDEVTVYFANGKTNVDAKYVPQLQTLADSAKSINGYMIEVKGYASTTGSASVNQALSEDRADHVSNILIQQGKIPLTRMLAPGAMGTSEQVGDPKSADGQAENRRVVVRILQNKAVAGT